MKLQNLLLIVLLFTWSHVALGKPHLYYFDSAGLERKTEWKTYQTYIWKQYGSFKSLKKQTWIALPPLLELTDSGQNISIVENNKSNNSPFVTNKNIKKVLVVEHQKPIEIIPLKKTIATKDNASVGLRIEDREFKSHLAVTQRCQSLGLNLDLLNSNPYLLSMDCRKEEDKVKVLIGFSGTLESIEALGGEILSSQPGANHVFLDYKEDTRKSKPKRLVANLSVKGQGEKKNEIFSLVFQSPSEGGSPIIQVTAEEEPETLFPQSDADSQLVSSDPHLRAGLMGSKIGLEAFLSSEIFTGSRQSIAGQLSFPFSYLGIRSNDRSYLDGTINYLWHWDILALGTGVRVIDPHHAPGLPFDNGPILGWNLRLASKPWLKWGDALSVRSALSYTPLAFDQVLRVQRARVEIMDVSVYDLKQGRFAGLLYYDLLEIDKGPFKFYDYKFVGGVTYQW